MHKLFKKRKKKQKTHRNILSENISLWKTFLRTKYSNSIVHNM